MAIRVTCTCGQVLQTGDEHAGRKGRCPGCGTILQLPSAPPAADAAPQGATAPRVTPGVSAPPGVPPWGPPGGPQPPPVAQPAYWAPYSPYGDEVYRDDFDLGQVDPQLLASWRACRLAHFSVGGAVALSLFTFGWFSLIFYGIQHGKFPRASHRDFGTGQAIGFMFIPAYSLYWAFRFFCGLVDRINLQLRLNNHPVPPVPRSLATAVCVLRICSVIPYLGCLVIIAAVICEAVLVSKIQTAINILWPPYPYPYPYQQYGSSPGYPAR